MILMLLEMHCFLMTCIIIGWASYFKGPSNDDDFNDKPRTAHEARNSTDRSEHLARSICGHCSITIAWKVQARFILATIFWYPFLTSVTKNSSFVSSPFLNVVPHMHCPSPVYQWCGRTSCSMTWNRPVLRLMHDWRSRRKCSTKRTSKCFTPSWRSVSIHLWICGSNIETLE